MPEIAILTRADLPAATAVLERAWPGRGAAVIAAEKLFAPGSASPVALGARSGPDLLAVAVVSGPYLRILAVAPDHRGAGLGTALLERASALATGPLIAAAEPGNYLTPGIDAGDAATIGWLTDRGFAADGEAFDLEIDVAANPRVSRARLDAEIRRLAAAGYRLVRAGDPDRAELEAGAAAAGHRAWAVEIARSLAAPSGVFIARDRGGALAGFAAHDGNNRGLGGFGPAAVAPAHRGRGVGAALLVACLVDVAAAGHPRCTVGWVGPRGFYERVAGVARERRYLQMRRGTR